MNLQVLATIATAQALMLIFLKFRDLAWGAEGTTIPNLGSSPLMLQFETKASYAVTVQADDPTVGGTPDASRSFVLAVSDVNEAPTAVSFVNTTTTLAENTNTASAIRVARITVTGVAWSRVRFGRRQGKGKRRSSGRWTMPSLSISWSPILVSTSKGCSEQLG